jgi:hypothetical protein
MTPTEAKKALFVHSLLLNIFGKIGKSVFMNALAIQANKQDIIL